MNSKHWFALAISIGLTAIEARAKAACPDPSPTQVVLYQGENFDGPCWVLDQGLYPSPSPFADEAVSSLQVGSAVNAQMFQDANYGGDVAFYGPGNYPTAGLNASASFSSAKVLPNDGISIAAKYLGNSNSDDGELTDVQGIANVGGYFYVTQTQSISVFPMNGTGTLEFPPVASTGIFPALANMGCNHYGDPDTLLVSPSVSYLLIPVEGCTFPDSPGYDSSMTTALAVVDPNTLSLVAYDALYENRANAAFLAIKGGSLYSAGNQVDGNNPIVTYAIDTTALYFDENPHFILYDGAPLYLTHEDGSPVSMGNMQGGVFSSDGQVFYTNNGYDTGCDAATEGDDWGGIRAFNASTGVRIASSSLTYGNFQFEWHCGFPQYQEPEGLDWADLGSGGILHAFMDDNFDAGAYFKHYNF